MGPDGSHVNLARRQDRRFTRCDGILRGPNVAGMTTNHQREAAIIGAGGLRGGSTFVGADHGGVPASFILDRSQPGDGPALHRHPYDEVWVLDEGRLRSPPGTARSAPHRSSQAPIRPGSAEVAPLAPSL
jgi:hypothetical protein